MHSQVYVVPRSLQTANVIEMVSLPPATPSPSDRTLTEIDWAFGEMLNKDVGIRRLVETADELILPARNISPKNTVTPVNEETVLDKNPAIPVVPVSDSVSRILAEIGDSEWDELEQIIEDIEQDSEDAKSKGGQSSSSSSVEDIANIISGKYLEYLEKEWTKRRRVWLKLFERNPIQVEKENSAYAFETFGEYISKQGIQLQVPLDLPEIEWKTPVLADQVSYESESIPTVPVDNTTAEESAEPEIMPSAAEEIVSESQEQPELVSESQEQEQPESVSVTPEKEDLIVNEAEPKIESQTSWWEFIFGKSKSKPVAEDDNNNINNEVAVESTPPTPNDDQTEAEAVGNAERPIEEPSIEGEPDVQLEAMPVSLAEDLSGKSEGELQQETVAVSSAAKVSGEIEAESQQETVASPEEKVSGEVEAESQQDTEASPEEVVVKSVELEAVASSEKLVARGEDVQVETATSEVEQSDDAVDENFKPEPSNASVSYTVVAPKIHPPSEVEDIVTSFGEEVPNSSEMKIEEQVSVTISSVGEMASDNKESLQDEKEKTTAAAESLSCAVEKKAEEKTSTAEKEASDDPIAPVVPNVDELENEWRIRRSIWLRGLQLILNKGQYGNSPYVYATFRDYVNSNPTKLQSPFELPDIELILLEAIANSSDGTLGRAENTPSRNTEVRREQPPKKTSIEASSAAGMDEGDKPNKHSSSWWSFLSDSNPTENNNNN